jgi:DNA-binding NtrC family response regulator
MSSIILLVDDDPHLLGAYQRQLRKRYNVHTAQGPEEGLTAFSKHPYAVVVSDMRMPGMNGLQFLARVREVSPQTVRIILTGDAGSISAEKAETGEHVFRFLYKPCSRESLTKCLEEALEEHARICEAGRNSPKADEEPRHATIGSLRIE